MSELYYTYTHKTPKGEVFYVGKGKGRRMYATSDRSIAWKEVVDASKGITIEMVNEFVNEEDAFADEVRLIAKYLAQGCALINATSGGKGAKDYCQSEDQRSRTSTRNKGRVWPKSTCPHCGTEGATKALKRWHMDNCTGANKKSAKIRINGTEYYLGKFSSAEEIAKARSDALIKYGDSRQWVANKKLTIDEASEMCEMIDILSLSFTETASLVGITSKKVSQICRGTGYKYAEEIK